MYAMLSGFVQKRRSTFADILNERTKRDVVIIFLDRWWPQS